MLLVPLARKKTQRLERENHAGVVRARPSLPPRSMALDPMQTDILRRRGRERKKEGRREVPCPGPGTQHRV